jgi:hypothetical protein
MVDSENPTKIMALKFKAKSKEEVPARVEIADRADETSNESGDNRREQRQQRT